MRSNKIKKIIKYIITFITPILLILVYLLYKELIVGKYIMKFENFLLADASSQYNSIYSYIWDVLRGNQSIFYSFGKSLGGNMASTIGYYASSPLNIFYLVGGKENIPTITFMIYLIKVGLSSLFMYMFLNYKLKKENNNILFSIMYSLCAYMVVYYFNNMWLDVVAITPLVLLGLEKLIKENKTILYSITLGIAIIANFYIAYMLCIFCILYFLYRMLLEYNIKEFNKYKKIILKFIIASLLGLGLSCILLVPAILNLNQTFRAKASVNSFEISNIFECIFDNFFAKLYIGSHNTNSWLSRNQANIYCGILPIVLNFYYYLNPRIKKKEKILSFSLLLILIISLLEPHLNYIWHGFSIPNGYIGRFSFLFSFYVIYIATLSYRKLEKIKPLSIIIFFIIFIIINFIIYYRLDLTIDFMGKKNVILTSLFFFAYLIFIVLILYLKNKELVKMLRFGLYIIVIIELIINYSMCFITSFDVRLFGSPSTYYKNMCSTINNLDENFYRIDGDYEYSLLETFMCNSKGITSSLSTNEGSLYSFWKKHGGSITYTTIFYDFNKLPILDSMLGVKYVKTVHPIHSNYLKEYKDYIILDEYQNKQNVYIYLNSYALSLGYLISDDYEEIYNNGNNSNSYESLNTSMKSLSGLKEDIMTPYKQQYIGNNEYEIYIDDLANYIYLSFNYDVFTNVDNYSNLYIDDYSIGKINSRNIGTYVVLNDTLSKKIKIKFKNSTDNEKLIKSMVAYRFNQSIFEKHINILKKNQLKNIKINNNKVIGSIKVNKPSTLFLSIPYDRGWNVYVDGKKVKYKKILDEFIGIDLEKGNHIIEMKYISPGFILGLIISSVSVVVIILNYIFKERRLPGKKD